jgi:hypothetical protein
MMKNVFLTLVVFCASALIAVGRPAERAVTENQSNPAEHAQTDQGAPVDTGVLPSSRLTVEGRPVKLLNAASAASTHLEVEGPEEYPDDPPVPAKVLERRPRRPARDVVMGRFTSIQVNVDSFGNNIVDDAANEPSIAIDPTNPNRMVVGWRQFDSILSNFRQAGVAYSHDAGQTWTFPGVLDPGQFRSDPVLVADPVGNFYYSSLSSLASVEVFKSTDSGVTWGLPVPAFGGDKQWMTVDPTAGVGSGNLYQVWNVQFTCCPPNDFTWSNDGAATFASPIALPLPSMKWGTLAVGPDGELYAAGSTLGQTGHLLTKSTNAQNPGQTPVYDFIVNVDLGGVTMNAVGPNPGGMLGQVWVAVDHSGGPTNGNVYILGSVDPAGADPLDVNFVRSTDGGLTWSDPVRVSDGPIGAWDWFGTMAIAPNGRIDVTWNDTRNDATPDVPDLSELYYSFSLDAGETWSVGEPFTPPFDSYAGWPQQNKLGDYNQMVSDNGGSSTAYAATLNGEQDVFFVRLTPDCNGNGVADEIDVAGPTSDDCNGNLIPDECEAQDDCQPNGVQDICDIAAGTSADCNTNNVPDECEPDEDCNTNSVQDICDIAAGTSNDCNGDDTPDECQLTDNDCNTNAVPDDCDIADGTSDNCNSNDIPDECDIADSTSNDCQPDGVPDECQTADTIILPYYEACSRAADNGAAWCEDFESYPLGIVGSIDGLNGWSGWNGNPAAVGPVSMDVNHTPGGAKSLLIGVHDTVRTFTGYDLAASRAWVITAWAYIPAAMQGQADYIVLCDYDGGGAGTIWAVQLQMNGNTGRFVNLNNGQNVPLVTDRWAEIRLEADLQEDTVHIFYDGTLFDTEPWANAGGSMAIAAIDLYGPNTTGFYYDDLSIYSADVVTTDCNGNTTPDDCDIADLASQDCNGNVVPDSCETNEDCNSNGTQDICDVAPPTALDCNENLIPDGCETNEDCNGNTVQDICDIAAGTSADCNGNRVPDECELAGNDCNTNSVPDECDIMEAVSPDCNGNTVPDECDIASSTSDDCQPDDVPDDCQLDGLAVVVEPAACGPTADNGNPWCDDFESYSLGLIHGANGWEGWFGDPDQAGDVSNLQNHTASGTRSLQNALTDTTTRVMNGYDGSVSNAWEFRGWLYVASSTDGLAAILLWSDYDSVAGNAIPGAIPVVDPGAGLVINWLTGATMPAVLDAWTEIRILVDFDRDLAATFYNGVLLDLQPWTLGGGSLSIAAVSSGGGGGDGSFFADDFSLYPAMASFTTDCNANDVPDECDIAGLTSPDDNANGIPDECECPAATAAAAERLDIALNPVSQKIRYLSFQAGDAGRSEAVRVVFADVPAPYAHWAETQLWVQQPALYCENAGVAQQTPCPDQVGGLDSTSFWGAQLGCDPYWTDWTQYDLVHVWNEGIIPGGSYQIQAIDSTCLLDVESNYSNPLILAQSGWADLVQDCTTTPCKPPEGSTAIADVTAILDKWKNLEGNVKKARADVEGSPAGDHRIPDQSINITDVTYCLGAFLGETYPPPGFPPPGDPPSCGP